MRYELFVCAHVCVKPRSACGSKKTMGACMRTPKPERIDVRVPSTPSSSLNYPTVTLPSNAPSPSSSLLVRPNEHEPLVVWQLSLMVPPVPGGSPQARKSRAVYHSRVVMVNSKA